MHAEQRARAHKTLTDHRMSRALFADPLSVTWLTGFAPPPQLGPSPFAGGPSLVWYEGGEFVLIVVDTYADDAAASGCRVVTYRGYTIQEQLAGVAHLTEALRHVVGAPGARAGLVGVEESSLPSSLRGVLRTALPDAAEALAIDG